MTMNATCGGSSWYDREHVERLATFVRRMNEDHGVEAVTLANPFHIERIRAACPNIERDPGTTPKLDLLPSGP